MFFSFFQACDVATLTIVLYVLWDIFHKHWGVLVAKHNDACNLMGTIYSVVAGSSPITT